MLSHERIALLITTLYAVYSAWTYVGWFGVLLALNLSFISSDALMFFLKNNINHRMPDQVPEQTAGMEGQQSFFYGGQGPSSPETGSGPSSDRGPGIPSTSGTDFEMSSEDEVVRLLNCTDHYSALGLSRFENVDVTILKREYRKKVRLLCGLHRWIYYELYFHLWVVCLCFSLGMLFIGFLACCMLHRWT